MIVDQTIEKVSFCAPDRNHEKGFAYICRDGTTRRWMCHGFLAVKESVSVSSIFISIIAFVEHKAIFKVTISISTIYWYNGHLKKKTSKIRIKETKSDEVIRFKALYS